MKMSSFFRLRLAGGIASLCCAFLLVAFVHTDGSGPLHVQPNVQSAGEPGDGPKGDRGDVVEELYRELVGQTPSLKKLEDELDNLIPQSAALEKELTRSEVKSRHYYEDAQEKLVSISDPELKKKVAAAVTASQDQYRAKTAEIIRLLEASNQNLKAIEEHHQALKVLLTLPMIEGYQSKNMPDPKVLNQLLEDQKAMLEKIRKTFPA